MRGPGPTTLTTAEVTAAIEVQDQSSSSLSSPVTIGLNRFGLAIIRIRFSVFRRYKDGCRGSWRRCWHLCLGAGYRCCCSITRKALFTRAIIVSDFISLVASTFLSCFTCSSTTTTPLFSISYPRQRVCTKCWAKGRATSCRSAPLCPFCQGNHNKIACPLPIAQHRCLLCSSHQHSITGCGRFKSKFIRSNGVVPQQQQQQRTIQTATTTTTTRREALVVRSSFPTAAAAEVGALASNSRWGGARRKYNSSNNGDEKRGGGGGGELKNNRSSSDSPLPSSSSTSHLQLLPIFTSTSLGASPSMLTLCTYMAEIGLAFLHSSSSCESPVPHSLITDAIKQLQALLQTPTGTARSSSARPHHGRTATTATAAATAAASMPATRTHAPTPSTRSTPAERSASMPRSSRRRVTGESPASRRRITGERQDTNSEPHCHLHLAALHQHQHQHQHLTPLRQHPRHT